jgi:hypothetical protein
MPSTAHSRDEILALYRAALAWEDEGQSASAIHQNLMERGMGDQQAAEMVAKLGEYRAAFVAPPLTATDAVGIAMWALGLLVMLLGTGLFLGNITGLAPSVPFAGFVVMGLGSALLTAAANRTNWI